MAAVLAHDDDPELWTGATCWLAGGAPTERICSRFCFDGTPPKQGACRSHRTSSTVVGLFRVLVLVSRGLLRVVDPATRVAELFLVLFLVTHVLSVTLSLSTAPGRHCLIRVFPRFPPSSVICARSLRSCNPIRPPSLRLRQGVLGWSCSRDGSSPFGAAVRWRLQRRNETVVTTAPPLPCLHTHFHTPSHAHLVGGSHARHAHLVQAHLAAGA